MLLHEARLLDGTPLAEPAAARALREHALDAYPQECLGYIDQAGRYHQLRNMADEPEKHAVPDKRVLSGLLHRGQLRALCHSHPDGHDCPSEADGRAQLELEVPFIIVATNGQATALPFAFGDQLLDDAPIPGRPFRHYVQDCYKTMRIWWFRERGELLPEFPRNWEWWLPGVPGEKDLYRRYFEECGFHRIDRAQVRHGDVWLAAVRSSVPNHAGIYLDGGLALHHPTSGLAYDPMRLSKREPIARWLPFIRGAGECWLRRE